MEVCEKVTEEDYRLTPPRDCPAPMIPIMEQCWEEEPGERGTFASIHSVLVEIARTLSDVPISKGKKVAKEDKEGPEDIVEEPNESLQSQLEDGDYAEPSDVQVTHRQRDGDGSSSGEEEGAASYAGPSGDMYVRQDQKGDSEDQML